jgi:predicted nucleic acid-binding Zn ribbon protein
MLLILHKCSVALTATNKDKLGIQRANFTHDTMLHFTAVVTFFFSNTALLPHCCLSRTALPADEIICQNNCKIQLIYHRNEGHCSSQLLLYDNSVVQICHTALHCMNTEILQTTDNYNKLLHCLHSRAQAETKLKQMTKHLGTIRFTAG